MALQAIVLITPSSVQAWSAGEPKIRMAHVTHEGTPESLQMAFRRVLAVVHRQQREMHRLVVWEGLRELTETLSGEADPDCKHDAWFTEATITLTGTEERVRCLSCGAVL